MPAFQNSIDQIRLRRRVEKLAAEAMGEPHAERRARAEIGRARAQIKRNEAVMDVWADKIMTRN